ncbi:MAG: C10 family peptidase, partial [bacterium]
MRTFKIFTILPALAFATFAACEAKAATYADTTAMTQVARNWLTYFLYYKDYWAGSDTAWVEDTTAIFADDTLFLGLSFTIWPSGHVVVPKIKQLSPVKSYSEWCGPDFGDTVGYPQFVKDELLALRRAWEADTSQYQHIGWTEFTLDSAEFSEILHERQLAPLWQIGPLCSTEWNQSPPYNDSCPPGDSDTCLVGCVALAAAQIMAYHQWPPSGIGQVSKWEDGDPSCGVPAQTLVVDLSDGYDWANMPDICDFNNQCSGSQIAAVSELCYEVGVTLKTNYGCYSSGAYPDDVRTELPPHFCYRNVIDRENRRYMSRIDWWELIAQEISAERPMHYNAYFIRADTDTFAHSFVCDGAESSAGGLKYHMNYGWGGACSDWYAVDSIYCSPDTLLYLSDFLLRNIIPIEGCCLSGELSGTIGPDTCYVLGNISISSGNVVQIVPGTVLIFDGSYSFDIYGTLLALGTEDDSVIFTTDISTNHMGWRGLRFYEGSSFSSLDYCRIEHGRARGSPPNDNGGGVYCYGASPKFFHCTLTANKANGYGGGVYCDSASPTFTNCTMENDTACYHGGGICCLNSSSPELFNCIIKENVVVNTGYGGGGIACLEGSSPTLTNCILETNTANYGGAVHCEEADPIFEFCTIRDNVATEGDVGGGVYYESGMPTFDGPYPFNIYGTLLAEGMEGDSIVFTSSEADDWRGLVFSDSSSSGCTLTYSIIENVRLSPAVECNQSSPSFFHCTIRHNRHADTSSYGGGVYCKNCAPNFTNCTIHYNEAWAMVQWPHTCYPSKGGGVYCTTASPTFTNCTISDNNASGGDGGGVYCETSSRPIFVNCILGGNTASRCYSQNGNGGAVFCGGGCSPEFSYCTLYRDSADAFANGGGIYCASGCYLICNSTIIAFCRGEGIYFEDEDDSIAYCDFFDNSIGPFGGTVPESLGVICRTNA